MNVGNNNGFRETQEKLIDAGQQNPDGAEIREPLT